MLHALFSWYWNATVVLIVSYGVILLDTINTILAVLALSILYIQYSGVSYEQYNKQ